MPDNYPGAWVPNLNYRQTKQRFADQFNRSTPQDYDVAERASLLPLALYANGQTGLAWPGMVTGIADSFTAPARAYRGEIPQEDMIAEGLNFAGNMAMGGSAVPRPSNAAKMFGGGLAKTADHNALAANLLRSASNDDVGQALRTAREMSNPMRVYHGTGRDFDKFKLDAPAMAGSILYSNSNSAVPGTVIREAGDNALSRRSSTEIGKPRDPNTPPLGAQREGVQSRLDENTTPKDMAQSTNDAWARLYGPGGKFEIKKELPRAIKGNTYSQRDRLIWELQQRGIKTSGKSNSAKSGSAYVYVDTPEGALKVRFSDHELPRTSTGDAADIEAGVDWKTALDEILRKYGILGTLGGGAAAAGMMGGSQPSEAAPVPGSWAGR